MVSTCDETTAVTNGEAIITPKTVESITSGATVDNTSDHIKVITDEEFDKATKTFQLGKKNLYLNKLEDSVNNIEEACKIYATKFGEFDPQCADIYFFYGKALLELARVENTVLGNALSGVPEDNEPINDSRYGNPDDVTPDEKKDISDKVISALCDPTDEAVKNGEDATPETATATTTETITPVEVEGGSEVTKATEIAIAEAAAEGAEEEEDDDDEDEEGEDEDLTKTDEQAKDEAEAEEISNLQRSWEMFELAKLIYSKNFDNDPIFKQKRIAECLLKLGEISIEQEIYDQAISDLTESIRIQEAETPENRDERMLAECFYQLALAQQFSNGFTESTEAYQKAINIMKLRVEKLQGKCASITATDGDADLEKETIKNEIADLEALIPDLVNKMDEMTESGQQAIKEAKEMILGTTETASSTPPATNGDVKDITNMLKSKRKISSSSLEGIMKKTRSDVAETTETTSTEEMVTEPVIVATTTTVDVSSMPAETPAATVAE